MLIPAYARQTATQQRRTLNVPAMSHYEVSNFNVDLRSLSNAFSFSVSKPSSAAAARPRAAAYPVDRLLWKLWTVAAAAGADGAGAMELFTQISVLNSMT